MFKRFISNVLMIALVMTNTTFASDTTTLDTVLTIHKREQYGLAFNELQKKAESLSSKEALVKEVSAHFPENSESRTKFLEAISEVKDSPFKTASFKPTTNGGEIETMGEKIQVDFENEVITIQNKAYSFKDKTAEQVFSTWLQDLESKKTTSYSISLIEEAHAVIPLIYVAIVVVVAAGVVVTKVAASSINHYRNLSCERKVQIFLSTIETKANTCELNLNQVASTPALLSQALNFKKNYKGKPQDVCKQSLKQNKEFMKKAIFQDPVTCVSDEAAVQICKKLKAVEACQTASAKAVNNGDRASGKGLSSSQKSNPAVKKTSKQ